MTIELQQNTGTACTCYWVDPKYWTTHYGAVEPGSTMEPNPDCPEHFPQTRIEWTGNIQVHQPVKPRPAK
jgi:hypothetical protein